MGKERDSNIELLRCVLMFMVVGTHIVYNSVLSIKNPVEYGVSGFYIGHFIESFCIMAVNCYVLISGYFGIRASFSKLLKLYLPILFYSIIIFLAISLVFEYEFDKKNIYYLIPFISSQYWFVTFYILLFLISPLLNIILNNLSKKQLQVILMIGIFLFVIIPTITPFSYTKWDRGFGLINFILLYFVGFYLKTFFKNGGKTPNKYIYLLIFVSICLLMFFMDIVCAKFLGYNKGFFNKFYGYDTILVYAAAISFFLFFRSISINFSFINRISPLVFYVYIIHEHPALKKVLYTRIFDLQDYYSDRWGSYLLFAWGSIYIICLIIEYIRRSLFNKVEDRIVDVLNNKVYVKLKNKVTTTD